MERQRDSWWGIKKDGKIINKNVPTTKWGEFGYVWASVEVKKQRLVCRDKAKDMNTCEPLADGLNIAGEVDEQELNTVKEILSTFKFTKQNQ